MDLVMLGSPGSGKGTQARMLARRYSLLQVSTGDILREAVFKETSLGKRARSFMESGALVPDELVIGLIGETLEKQVEKGGVIFDGFPRTIKQADALQRLLNGRGERVDLVIYLEVSSEEVVRRLSLRRSCPNCNRLYNVVSDPSADGLHCDECKAELIVREDDREDVILNRLEVYGAKTLPILQWYEEMGEVLRVDGEKDSMEIHSEICRFLDGAIPREDGGGKSER
jgi:adenylate kinase